MTRAQLQNEVLDGPDLTINEWALIMTSLKSCEEMYGNIPDVSGTMLLSKLEAHFKIKTVP